MLNIVNFSSVAPWSPRETTEGLTVHPDPQLHFISQFMQNTEFLNIVERRVKLITECHSIAKSPLFLLIILEVIWYD